MSNDTTASRARPRKPGRPKKPYPTFPLTPHPGGKWQKKINGKIRYFGRWGQVVRGSMQRLPGDGWREALDEYERDVADRRAGRTPQAKTGGLTVASLCNEFLTHKLDKLNSGEMKQRTFNELKETTDLLVSSFGATRLVDDLAPDDFGALRASLAKRWGVVRLVNGINRVKGVFKYALVNGRIERPVRYGTKFALPSKKVMRLHRAKAGEKLLEAEDLRTLLDGSMVPGGDFGPELVRPSAALRAAILLGLNCGFGNTDIATLPLSALDLDKGWVTYPRPKTGIARRCPLWAETVAALRLVVDSRPQPATLEAEGLVFLTEKGRPCISAGLATPIALPFTGLLKLLGMHRRGLGFYTLRHVFRTVADAARDPVAIDIIMGHADASMGARYRERVDDTRLEAVTEHVRRWLFGVN